LVVVGLVVRGQLHPENAVTHAANGRHLQDLLAAWADLRRHAHQLFNDFGQSVAEVVRDFRVNSFENLFIKAGHIVGAERRL
jgi:hypothetical protein